MFEVPVSPTTSLPGHISNYETVGIIEPFGVNMTIYVEELKNIVLSNPKIYSKNPALAGALKILKDDKTLLHQAIFTVPEWRKDYMSGSLTAAITIMLLKQLLITRGVAKGEIYNHAIKNKEFVYIWYKILNEMLRQHESAAEICRQLDYNILTIQYSEAVKHGMLDFEVAPLIRHSRKNYYKTLAETITHHLLYYYTSKSSEHQEMFEVIEILSRGNYDDDKWTVADIILADSLLTLGVQYRLLTVLPNDIFRDAILKCKMEPFETMVNHLHQVLIENKKLEEIK